MICWPHAWQKVLLAGRERAAGAGALAERDIRPFSVGTIFRDKQSCEV